MPLPSAAAATADVPHALTTKQAKASFRARGSTGVSATEQKWLQRALQLEERAERARAAEEGKRKRKAAAAATAGGEERLRREREERERVERLKMGTQRRLDRWGYKSSQLHLGRFFGGGGGAAAGGATSAVGGEGGGVGGGDDKGEDACQMDGEEDWEGEEGEAPYDDTVTAQEVIESRGLGRDPVSLKMGAGREAAASIGSEEVNEKEVNAKKPSPLSADEFDDLSDFDAAFEDDEIDDQTMLDVLDTSAIIDAAVTPSAAAAKTAPLISCRESAPRPAAVHQKSTTSCPQAAPMRPRVIDQVAIVPPRCPPAPILSPRAAETFQSRIPDAKMSMAPPPPRIRREPVKIAPIASAAPSMAPPRSVVPVEDLDALWGDWDSSTQIERDLMDPAIATTTTTVPTNQSFPVDHTGTADAITAATITIDATAAADEDDEYDTIALDDFPMDILAGANPVPHIQPVPTPALPTPNTTKPGISLQTAEPKPQQTPAAPIAHSPSSGWSSSSFDLSLDDVRLLEQQVPVLSPSHAPVTSARNLDPVRTPSHHLHSARRPGHVNFPTTTTTTTTTATSSADSRIAKLRQQHDTNTTAAKPSMPPPRLPPPQQNRIGPPTRTTTKMAAPPPPSRPPMGRPPPPAAPGRPVALDRMTYGVVGGGKEGGSISGVCPAASTTATTTTIGGRAWMGGMSSVG